MKRQLLIFCLIILFGGSYQVFASDAPVSDPLIVKSVSFTQSLSKRAPLKLNPVDSVDQQQLITPSKELIIIKLR